MRYFLPTLTLLAALVLPAAAIEPWATYRGNSQRTGNTDNVAGPKGKPRVLWVHKTKEHYIAAPVPAGDRLFVSGLGAFNVTQFACLSTDPKAAKRVLWSKSTPYLKLPTVSSPGLVGDRLVFGDGMHQTDGALLHCLSISDGLPQWQLPLPGKLVHLEGSPTIEKGHAYIGGGAAGVLCIDVERVSLEGKEMAPAAVRKILSERWQQLLAKYEKDRKTDEFAVPPSEDQLPKVTPKRLWQVGQEKWHVDAPVAVAGDRVLVATAFLDHEKVGERALYCLDAKDGTTKWKTPLKFNPWGGAAVLGDTVVVAGSSINYDTKALKNAKGEVVALNLADGAVKWRKDLKAGVLSCAALADGVAVVTASDGKVRAYDLADGGSRWTYDTKSNCFAAPAIVGGTVYVGDLKGVVHAIELATGGGRWTLDLGQDPAVQAPGMIYGGPVVHGGKVYVATCNLEGPNVGQPTAVVCIGE
jgi:outer membrane protein assembly factor BamB